MDLQNLLDDDGVRWLNRKPVTWRMRLGSTRIRDHLVIRYISYMLSYRQVNPSNCDLEEWQALLDQQR